LSHHEIDPICNKLPHTARRGMAVCIHDTGGVDNRLEVWLDAHDGGCGETIKTNNGFNWFQSPFKKVTPRWMHQRIRERSNPCVHEISPLPKMWTTSMEMRITAWLSSVIVPNKKSSAIVFPGMKLTYYIIINKNKVPKSRLVG
jgi:hypothetical protein